jgi:hypothetical protein
MDAILWNHSEFDNGFSSDFASSLANDLNQQSLFYK